MTHTSGPWKQYPIVCKGQPEHERIDICAEEGWNRICTITGINIARYANANLISASPELLEALKLIAYWWDDGYTQPLNPGALLGDDDRTIKQTILDAIAKAEGKTNA